MCLPKTNLFLESLSAESRDLLVKQCVEIDLPLRKSLYEAENVPRYAYFLTSGIASIVAAMDDGNTAEVGLIGREGVVGSFHLLGPANVQPPASSNWKHHLCESRSPDLSMHSR